MRTRANPGAPQVATILTRILPTRVACRRSEEPLCVYLVVDGRRRSTALSG